MRGERGRIKFGMQDRHDGDPYMPNASRWGFLETGRGGDCRPPGDHCLTNTLTGDATAATPDGPARRPGRALTALSARWAAMKNGRRIDDGNTRVNAWASTPAWP